MGEMLTFVGETARKSVRKDKQLMTYDFDKPIDRTGTCDVKHARLAEMWHRTDLIPLWVADMDFETAPCIVRALQGRVAHGIFGADMKVDLVNDGPFTIVLDTDNL